MRTYRSQSGPFKEQPFFELAEIEAICETALRDVELLPKLPEPIRIDRFVEKRFGVDVAYEDLPPGILGYTSFGKTGVEAIIVARDLDEDTRRSSGRRVRTTIAHEAGHGLLHAHLFALGRSARSLFGDGLDGDQPKVLCRDGDVHGTDSPRTGPSYRWWEYQANQAMAALLLPRLLINAAIEPLLASPGVMRVRPVLPEENRDAAVGLISECFDVNGMAARFRLDRLYPSAQAGQLTL